HSTEHKADVYLNTLNGNLIDLQNLLSDLQLTARHWLCGYRHLLKNVVKQYCVDRNLNLKKLDYLETFVYHLPQEAIQSLDYRSIADISFGPLHIEHAALVDEHWPYRSSDSLALIRSRIRHNISVGAFDGDGHLLAWCLRSIHGTLSNLHVLPSHRRLGLASVLVRLMAQEIAASGAEVLATIAFDNDISQMFFEKLGFKHIDDIYYTMVPTL
ncbi:GH11462, partial [Drosophila grimshawi]